MLRNEFTLPAALAALEPMRLGERALGLDTPGWLYEFKFNGFRLMAQFGSGKASLMTGNGADATKWFPEVAASLAEIPGGAHIVDGEVCVLDDHGRSDYAKLRARAKRRRWHGGADQVTYCVFDLLVENDVDLMSRPLQERKRHLFRLLPAAPSLLYVSHVEGHGRELMAQTASLDLEGLVAKRADSAYEPGMRSPDWIKIEDQRPAPEQEAEEGEWGEQQVSQF